MAEHEVRGGLADDAGQDLLGLPDAHDQVAPDLPEALAEVCDAVEDEPGPGDGGEGMEGGGGNGGGSVQLIRERMLRC